MKNNEMASGNSTVGFNGYAVLACALLMGSLASSQVKAQSAVVGNQQPSATVSMTEIDHSVWDLLLQKYVNERGMVRYAACLLYTSPSPRDKRQTRMPSSA